MSAIWRKNMVDSIFSLRRELTLVQAKIRRCKHANMIQTLMIAALRDKLLDFGVDWETSSKMLSDIRKASNENEVHKRSASETNDQENAIR